MLELSFQDRATLVDEIALPLRFEGAAGGVRTKLRVKVIVPPGDKVCVAEGLTLDKAPGAPEIEPIV